MPQILVVDDDPVQRRLLEAVVTKLGLAARTAPGGGPALDLLLSPKSEGISLVLLDLVMPDVNGIDVLTKLRAVNGELPVIVLTAKGGIDSAVDAMRAGANDFLVKPASPERIKVSIQNALKLGVLSGEVTRLKKKRENRLAFDDLIARSAPMRQVIRLGQRAAQSNIPILIEGESGVGQGADCARDTGQFRTRRQAVRHRQLRRHSGKSGREHPVRPRERLVHRRHRQTFGQIPGSRWRHAVS